MPADAPTPATENQSARRGGVDHRALAADLDRRFRRRLTRYARSLLGRSHHDAEDVVQDVLLRAHVELTAGRGPEEIGPWLYRLTRNRAIDELRRARWGDVSLETEPQAEGARAVAEPVDHRAEPEVVMRRRLALRDLVADLADLPVNQRTALLAREVDGEPATAVAARLGVSVEATQMLVVRARAGLVRARDARDADCGVVRQELVAAQVGTGRRRGAERLSAQSRRHVEGCAPCKAYRRDLRRLETRLQLLAPPSGLFAMLGIGKLFSGKLLAVLGVSVGTVAAIATWGVVGTPGVDVVSSTHTRTGQRTPVALFITPSMRNVKRGGSVPPGFSLVTAEVALPYHAPVASRRRLVTFTCPADERFASLIPTRAAALGMGYGLVGDPYNQVVRSATIRLGAPERPGAHGTLGIICQHLDVPAENQRYVDQLSPAASGTVPSIRGRVVLYRNSFTRRSIGMVARVATITLRLTGEPAPGKSGFELFADRGDGDVHHLVDADYSVAGGHCFQFTATRRIAHWHPGERSTVRVWIGDGHGHAALTTVSAPVPRPVRRLPLDGPKTSDTPTGKLGCFSPHL